MASKIQTASEKLAALFLEQARSLSDDIGLIKVLKSRTYHIGGSNVLIRVATEGTNRRFFYGINYLHIEGRNTVEENLHSILQGRLLEISNIRGYKTYCPNKSKVFNMD